MRLPGNAITQTAPVTYGCAMFCTMIVDDCVDESAEPTAGVATVSPTLAGTTTDRGVWCWQSLRVAVPFKQNGKMVFLPSWLRRRVKP